MCDFDPPCVIHPLPVSLWPPIERDAIGQGMKAAARRDEGRISVDSSFFDPLHSQIAQLGLLCHEKAHLEGADCESCADRRGGQILRELGVDTDGPVVAMLLSSIQHRDARKAALDFDQGYRGIRGARAADAATCGATVDNAGLCKSPTPGAVPVMSFHSIEGLDARRAKARARGIDQPVGWAMRRDGTCHPFRANEARDLGFARGGGRVARGRGSPLIGVFGGTVEAVWPIIAGDSPLGGCFPDLGDPMVLATVRRAEEKAGYGADDDGGTPQNPAAALRPPDAPIADDSTGTSSSPTDDSSSDMAGGNAAIVYQLMLGSPGVPNATLVQTFPTTQSPSDRFVDIIADQALAKFPGDPLRYAWLLLATIDREAPRVSGKPGIFDPLGQGKPNRDRSIDYGLAQINGLAHAAQIAATNPDGSLQWQDARQNIGMGADVLAEAKAAWPGNIPKQLLSYAGTKRFAAETYAKSGPSAYLSANLPVIPSGSTPEAKAARLAILQNDPAIYLLARLKGWGAPDVMDDSQWSTRSDAATQKAESTQTLGTTADLEARASGALADAEAFAIRNWYWELGGFVLIAIIIAVVVARHYDRKRKGRK